MKNLITLLLLLSFLVSCQNPNPSLEKELSETKARLAAAKAALEKLNSKSETPLVHEIFFNIKDDLTLAQIEEFHQNISKLKNIPVVHNLVIGDFKDLNDARALSDYEVKISMEFKNEKEYAEYQAHPIHLKSKEETGGFLAGPPAGYDFIKK